MPHSNNAPTVLIAEDDYVNLRLMERILKKENLSTCFANNGQEAVSMVENHPEINLVLMDIEMPVMNGYDATRQIKQLRPELPVIAHTAFSSREDKEKALEAGCTSFITMPIKKRELLELVQSLLLK